MQWAAADQNLCANVDQVAQSDPESLPGLCGNLTNSGLTTGQQTSSVLSVDQLCKAVATTRTTKAAAVACQIAESQKVSTLTHLVSGIQVCVCLLK